MLSKICAGFLKRGIRARASHFTQWDVMHSEEAITSLLASMGSVVSAVSAHRKTWALQTDNDNRLLTSVQSQMSFEKSPLC